VSVIKIELIARALIPLMIISADGEEERLLLTTPTSTPLVNYSRPISAILQPLINGKRKHQLALKAQMRILAIQADASGLPCNLTSQGSDK
jgi:hypothetical protein